MAKGADMNAKDMLGQTAVAHALVEGHDKTATFLVTAGADWDIDVPVRDELPWPLFSFCVANGKSSVVKAIVRRMRADGLEGAAVIARLERAAGLAVIKRSLPSLKALVEEGLDVAQVRCDVGTAGLLIVGGLLHVACQYRHQEKVAFLVTQGCDALAPDSFGHLPHHIAAMCDDLEVLQWLLGNVPGLHPDLEVGRGKLAGLTALYFAATNGSIDVVK